MTTQLPQLKWQAFMVILGVGIPQLVISSMAIAGANSHKAVEPDAYKWMGGIGVTLGSLGVIAAFLMRFWGKYGTLSFWLTLLSSLSFLAMSGIVLHQGIAKGDTSQCYNQNVRVWGGINVALSSAILLVGVIIGGMQWKRRVRFSR